jgi:hypothetical protein
MAFFARAALARRFITASGDDPYTEVVKAWHNHDGDDGDNAVSGFMYYIEGKIYQYSQIHNITSMEGTGVSNGEIYVFEYVNLGGAAPGEDDALYQLAMKAGGGGLQAGIESNLWSPGHSKLRM